MASKRLASAGGRLDCKLIRRPAIFSLATSTCLASAAERSAVRRACVAPLSDRVCSCMRRSQLLSAECGSSSATVGGACSGVLCLRVKSLAWRRLWLPRSAARRLHQKEIRPGLRAQHQHQPPHRSRARTVDITALRMERMSRTIWWKCAGILPPALAWWLLVQSSMRH